MRSRYLIGRSHRPWWQHLLGRSFVARMLNEAHDFDLHIVGLDEPESVVRERARQVPSLRRRVVVVGEAVDADDLVAFREQAVDERASDEPGCTGDDDGHGESL